MPITPIPGLEIFQGLKTPTNAPSTVSGDLVSQQLTYASPSWKNSFNTPIPENRVAEYNKFILDNEKAVKDLHDYDVAGAWLNGEYQDTDTSSAKYRKPNHPLFSRDSLYHGVDGYLGGQETESMFLVGPANRKFHQLSDIQEILRKYAANKTVQDPFAGEEVEDLTVAETRASLLAKALEEDYEPQKFTEFVAQKLDKISQSSKNAWHQSNAAQLRFQQAAFGQDKSNEIQAELNKVTAVKPEGITEEVLINTAEFIPYQVRSAVEAGKGYIAGAAVGAPIGAALSGVLPFTQVIHSFGKLGAKLNAFNYMMQVEGGGILLQVEETAKKEGLTLDKTKAERIAMAVAPVSALLEYFQLKGVAGAVTGQYFKKSAFGGFAKKFTNRMAQFVVTRSVVKGAAIATTQMAEQVTQEVLQEIDSIFAEEFTYKHYAGLDDYHLTEAKQRAILARLKDVARKTVLGVAPIVGLPTVIHTGKQISTELETKSREAGLQKLQNSVALAADELKVSQKNPDGSLTLRAGIKPTTKNFIQFLQEGTGMSATEAKSVTYAFQRAVANWSDKYGTPITWEEWLSKLETGFDQAQWDFTLDMVQMHLGERTHLGVVYDDGTVDVQGAEWVETFRELFPQAAKDLPRFSIYGQTVVWEKGNMPSEKEQLRVTQELAKRGFDIKQHEDLGNIADYVKSTYGMKSGNKSFMPQMNQEEVTEGSPLSKFYSREQELRGQYILNLPLQILKGESKLSLDKPLPKEQVLGRFKSMQGISFDELEYYKEQGLEAFLDTKPTLTEVAFWMQEHGPRVERVELLAVGKEQTKDEIEYANLMHWLDSYDDAILESVTRYLKSLEDGTSGKTVETFLEEEKPLIEKFISKEDKDFEKNLRRMAKLATTVVKTKLASSDSATAKYEFVNPKPLSEMPGAVDLLVRIPTQVWSEPGTVPKIGSGITDEEAERALRGVRTNIKFPASSSHYAQSGNNLLVHTRAYFETLPNGDKVFHVFEIQSDWAQKRRDLENNFEVQIHEPTGKWIIFKKDVGVGINRNRGDSQRAQPTFYGSKEEAEQVKKEILSTYDSLQSDPLLKHYEPLAVKAAINYAKQNGAKYIAFSDAETAMLSEQQDQNIILFPTKQDAEVWQKDHGGSIREVSNTTKQWKNQETIFEVILMQELGMRLHYDKSIPKIAQKLTKSDGVRVSFGEHQNTVNAGENPEGLTGNRYRDTLIFKNPDGTFKTDITARMYSLDKVVDPRFSLFQKQKNKLGSITLMKNGKYLISFFKESGANISTGVHELAHFLLSTMPELQREEALSWLKLNPLIFDKWLAGEELTVEEHKKLVKAHETFARTLEQYFKTGKAPSTKLEAIFAGFKRWFSEVYQENVPGSKFNATSRKFFDGVFASDKDRFGKGDFGTIYSPARGKAYKVYAEKVKTKTGELVRKYVNIKQGGKIHRYYVDEIIDGNELTPTQEKLFGKNVVWHTEEDEVTKQKQFELAGLDLATLDKMYYQELLLNLPTMERKKLEKWGRKLGLSYVSTIKDTEELRALVVVKFYEKFYSNQSQLDDATWESFKSIYQKMMGHRDPNVLQKAIHQLEWYYGQVIDQVRKSNGGSEITRREAEKLETVVNQQNAFARELRPFVHAVQVLSHKPTQRNEVSELMDVVYLPSGKGGVAKIAAAIDERLGEYLTEGLSTKAQKIVEELRKLIGKAGDMAQREGLLTMLLDPDTGKWERKVFEPRYDRFNRFWTDDFYRIMVSKDSKSEAARGVLAEVLAEMNGKDKVYWIKVIDSIRGEQTFRRINMEIQRLIPKMPTFIHAGNQVIHLLETRPFHFAAKLSERTSSRLGFIKTYPQDLEELNRIITRFSQQGKGFAKDLEMAFRVAHGLPSTDFMSMPIDSSWMSLAKTMKHAGRLIAALRLSRSAFWTVLEMSPFGKIPFNVGQKAYWEAVGITAKSLTKHPVQRAITGIANIRDPRSDALKGLVNWAAAQLPQNKTDWERLHEHIIDVGGQLERMDYLIVRSDKTANWLARNIEKGADISDLVAQEVLTLTQVKGVNNFAELLSAVAAEQLIKKLKSGAGSLTYDKPRLELMGYSKEEVTKLLSGGASQELYDTLYHRVPTAAQGTRALPLQRSPWANWRASTTLIRFDTYSRFTLRNMVELWSKFAVDPTVGNLTVLQKALAHGYNATLPLHNPLVAQYVWGHAANGAMAYALLGLMYGGPGYMLYSMWNPGDDWDDNLKALLSNITKQVLGGPWMSVIYQLNSGKVLGDAIINSMFVPGIITQLCMVISGTGKYDEPGLGRWVKYAQDNVPAAKTLTPWVMAMAFGEENRKRDLTIKKANEFIHKYVGRTGINKFAPTLESEELLSKVEDRERMHVAMKQVYNEMTKPMKGVDLAKWQHTSESAQKITQIWKDLLVGTEQKDRLAMFRSAQQSLRSKKILSEIPVELADRLKKTLTEEEVRIIVQHDLMLELAARGIIK